MPMSAHGASTTSESYGAKSLETLDGPLSCPQVSLERQTAGPFTDPHCSGPGAPIDTPELFHSLFLRAD